LWLKRRSRVRAPSVTLLYFLQMSKKEEPSDTEPEALAEGKQ
jgi:hypothetical protein